MFSVVQNVIDAFIMSQRNCEVSSYLTFGNNTGLYTTQSIEVMHLRPRELAIQFPPRVGKEGTGEGRNGERGWKLPVNSRGVERNFIKAIKVSPKRLSDYLIEEIGLIENGRRNLVAGFYRHSAVVCIPTTD